MKILSKFTLCILIYMLLSCQLVSRTFRLNNQKLPSFKNSIGMEFLEVPEGKFMMGCSNSESDCDEDELPSKKVEIKKTFYLGKYEVTKQEFGVFVNETSYKSDAEKFGFTNTWKNCQNIKQEENHPVICVSWNDAKAFTNWLTNKERKKYRLPKEEEWEYTARAGSNSRYPWGTKMQENYVWYNKNSSKTTQKVGTKSPNAWGFFDLIGNVWEWCEDSYDPDYFKRRENKDLPPNKNKNGKVLRGGSWFDSPNMLRVSTRNYAPADTRENHFGFRVLLEK